MPAAAPAIHDWMSVLADTTRTRVLRLLERHELTVAELRSVLQMPQSTVSRHLKVLSGVGWVNSRRDGTSRLYCLALDDLDPSARRLWLLIREQTGNGHTGDQDDRRVERVLARRQTRSQAFFASAAGQWDKLRAELFGERFDLKSLLGLFDRDWVVGDLGCGTGQLTESLAPFVKQVIAVDASTQMLTAARKRLHGLKNVAIRKGELHALPIDDGSLDAAVMSLVLHHLADPAAAIADAARVLQPNGRLLLIDMLHHDRREFEQEMGHVWLGFEPAQLAAWCDDAALEGFDCRALPVDPEARGPELLVAAARRSSRQRRGKVAAAKR